MKINDDKKLAQAVSHLKIIDLEYCHVFLDSNEVLKQTGLHLLKKCISKIT